MIVYQTDSNGMFTGQVMADPSPLEPGVWLIPGGCVETPPPEIPSGMMAVWGGDAWSLQPLPVDVPDEAEPVPEPTLEERRIAAQSQLVGMINAAADALTAGVPVAEMLSWGVKEQAARKVIAGEVVSDYEAAILDAECAITGETRAALSQRIAQLGDRYREFVGSTAGIRRKGAEAIAEATDAEALAAALQQAAAQLQALAGEAA